MKKILLSICFMFTAFSLVSCTTGDKKQEIIDKKETNENKKDIENKTIKVKTLNSKKEEIEIEVPINPSKVAVLDMASLDIIDSLGVGDSVVGSANTKIDYLQKYMNDSVKKLGTIKEADMEAVMSIEPQIIFIGARLAENYDELSKIAPVIYLDVNPSDGVLSCTEKNANIIASIYEKENKVSELMKSFNSRLKKLNEISKDKTAIVGLMTSGSYNVLGKDGRLSLISNEVGFNNIGVDEKIETSRHGNEVSFEFLLDKNPDYIFVMDRDAAIATEGAKLAKEIMENELIMKTDAYKNGHIIYLANPAVWYMAEGGIKALDIMISDLETELLK